jgi:hypothetical protein
MIKGRSPLEIRAILEIQTSPVSETPTVNFRDLPRELRRTCYEYLDMSVETLITFHKAVQGEEGDRDILTEFTEWTSRLLAIVSPIKDYLNLLVPGADIAMWRPRDDTLWRRVDGASQENGDHVTLSPAEFWRFTHYVGSDSPPMGRIEVDDKACLLIRKYDDQRFLVLCKRSDLVVFSRNWMMFWPITSLHIRPRDSIPDLDSVMDLFKPIKPEIWYSGCNNSREDTLPGTLGTRKILSLLNRVANQEWNGYPPKICLEGARDFAKLKLKWHGDPKERYYCGSRFEKPLLTADQKELERLLAEFNKMLEVEEEEERRETRRIKAMGRKRRRERARNKKPVPWALRTRPL